MFRALVEQYMEEEDTSLDAEIRRLELELRDLQARRSAAIAVAEARQLNAVDGHHSMKGYLRATCNWSNAEVARQRKLARLVDGHPEVGDAMQAGRIGVAQANLLAAVWANPRVSDQLAAIMPVFLDQAEHLPYDDFRVCVDHWVTQADLDGAFDEMVADVERRTARVTEIGGTVDITASGGDALVAATMVGIFDRFVQAEFDKDLEARRAEFDDDALKQPLPRTAGQRRFDALVAIFDAAIAAPAGGVAPEPVVNIIGDASTISTLFANHGLMDDARVDLDDLPTDPVDLLTRRCETSTGMVLHPELLLRALLTGQVRRLVVDSDGVVTDLGRRQRLFTGNARVAAQLVARRCAHNGCEVAAAFCDIDHLEEWVSDGGETNQRNARPRCGSHDRFKHRERWKVRRGPNGRIYNIRGDNTIVLTVGERQPDLSADEAARLARRRIDALVAERG